MSSTLSFIRLVQSIARLVRTNATLEPALQEMAQSGDVPTRRLAADLAHRLSQGRSLHEALVDSNSSGPSLGIAVDIGQASGHLDSSLESWAQLQMSQARHRMHMAVAMVYPTTLILIAICSLVYCLHALLPQYDSAFRELTNASTQWLDWLSWIRTNFFPISALIAFALVAPLLIVILRRRSTDRFGLARDPAIRLYQHAHVARLARLGIQSGWAGEQLMPLLSKACLAVPTSDSDYSQTAQIGQETASVLTSLETGAIQLGDADSLLNILGNQLQSSADFLSHRDGRWLPMIVSLAVGALVAFAYAVLIYLPWVVLFCYLATPALT